MRTRLSALLVLVVMVGAACGDDNGGGGGGDDGGGAYADAVTEALQNDESFGAFVDSEDQARCVGEGFVEAVGGEEAFEQADIEPEQLAAEEFDPESLGIEIGEAEAEGILDTLRDCDLDLIDLMIAGMGSDTELSPELQDCIRENLDPAVIETAIVSLLAGGDEDEITQDSEFISAMGALVSACPELAQMGG